MDSLDHTIPYLNKITNIRMAVKLNDAFSHFLLFCFLVCAHCMWSYVASGHLYKYTIYLDIYLDNILPILLRFSFTLSCLLLVSLYSPRHFHFTSTFDVLYTYLTLCKQYSS